MQHSAGIMTSNSTMSVTTDQDTRSKVTHDKVVEISNHYDGKIQLLTEEIDLLKVKLKDSDMELNKKNLQIQQLETRLGCNAKPSDAKLEKKYNSVAEACEYLNTHGANGVIMNGFLVWANIQRMIRPANSWKEEALSKFVKEEITEAKECLWRTCGDSIPTPM